MVNAPSPRSVLGARAGRAPVIVASARTPIGRAVKGALKDERPDDMVAQVIAAALGKVGGVVDEGLLDEVLVGCGSPSGVQGFNIARIATNLLGLDHVPGATVNRYCASSVQTTRQAAHAIVAGEARFVVSAGVESCTSYSNSDADAVPGTMNPLFDTARARTAEAESGIEPQWTDPRARGRLPDVYISMGQTAENVAALCDVSRRDQDEYAQLSQRRASAALDSGFWAREITPYTRADGSLVEADDSPRPGTTLDKLAALKPVFREHGTVTAGNACPLNDGASALVIGGEDDALALGIRPRARILATSATGLNPEIMGLGPVESVRAVLERTGMRLGDIDLVELNEAFAAQVLACQRKLGIDMDKLNVNGGAIAVGHPFGSTGARITNTILTALEDRDLSTGLVTMCVGGGQGMAMIVERMS
ncbi:acetyl-CoA acetyltransferase [Prauserella marina]|uniref:acetyl-CoA C-acyltransferase n=1 Tax=Prauserella marina TaxID=530584 RepID=A0A222VPF1_9PSEU|nr:acetyl-CoA C-acetyltransferase [Prauserella marina]ASR35805.1 acetyl-CoA acetyltransferase [Prauserella marina]PWV84291.1 acetyl-CoA C-acetyltransferase [Prauserella marina]SDC26100.1 acetyl-CoA C-acetyltransferase [Prauserella marina]